MTNPIAQQTNARKEFNALGRAEKNDITGVEIANQMLQNMENPNSPATLIQAASAVIYMQAVKNGETPITDAVNSLLKEKKAKSAKTSSNSNSFEPSFQ